MKKLFKEFREFALKGSIMDLAVAVILGGAVSAMVSALVDNILMPIVGIFMGGRDFSSLSITVGEAVIGYGAFIQAVINFLIIAVCIFAIVKALNKLRGAPEHKEEPPKPTAEEQQLACLKEIRDLLAKDKATKE